MRTSIISIVSERFKARFFLEMSRYKMTPELHLEHLETQIKKLVTAVNNGDQIQEHIIKRQYRMEKKLDEEGDRMEVKFNKKQQRCNQGQPSTEERFIKQQPSFE